MRNASKDSAPPLAQGNSAAAANDRLLMLSRVDVEALALADGGSLTRCPEPAAAP